MKQIYYTQCPIGYGLGASNGFQIKRKSDDYPLSGDFRHFSLRAFVAGTRLPAPATLRYRRGEGDVAEVAWLTPRSHEYETERGSWGRPGGHFAHGLQLDDAELRLLGDWPAGLFDRPFWTRSDPTPSRGRPPPPLELSASDLSRQPEFAAVAPLAEGEDIDRLARLLTALAAAAREGRTLFLIDEPERLAGRVALLTFAFPEPWRARLTFSTYHDRPEELPGFRLQGTIPAARPNRPALLAHGFVADLSGTAAGSGSGSIEPRVEPAGWAQTLAGWFIRHNSADQGDWEATRRRALRARAGPGEIWTDDWLERIFGLPMMIREPAPAPASGPEWSDLVPWTTWAGRAGLAGEWVRARPPAWWLTARGRAAEPGSRAALLKQLSLPDAWRGDARATAWGEVVALWARTAGEVERLETTSTALQAAPAAARPSFAGALIRGLSPDAAESTLRWLEAQTAWDRSILLPLRAPRVVAESIKTREPGALQDLLTEAMDLTGAVPAVLDAIAAEVIDRPEARTILAGSLALALGKADPRGIAEVHRWALMQSGESEAWLGSYWERLFVDPLNLDQWRERFDCIPQELREPLTRVLLRVAQGPQASPEAFRWGIEDLVLSLTDGRRPHESGWPGAYVDRLPSGLDLLKRLFTKEYRRLGVRSWLGQARGRGELSDAQAARIDECERYARVLMSGDARALLAVKLPEVPAAERGALLGQILGRLGDGSDDSINLALDSCRAAWPHGFQPGAPGLSGLAEALAEPLLGDRAYPGVWLARLERILDRLGLTASLGRGFEPDGFAAEVATATARRSEDGFDPWHLRKFLLKNDLAWKVLAADIRRELQGKSVDESREVLARWDQKLVKGGHTRRFYELWFNVCDAPQLVDAIAARTADTKNFDLPWWNACHFPGARNDVRERFARQAPLVPFHEGSLTSLRDWLRRPGAPSLPSNPEDLVPIESDRAARGAYDWLISDLGRNRWSFLEELTNFSNAGSMSARLDRLKHWYKTLRLDSLESSDRYQFLASIIRLLNEFDSVLIDCLAKWLIKCSVTDVEQIRSWDRRLSEHDPVPYELVLSRVELVSVLCDELRKLGQEAKERARKTGFPGSS